VEGIMRRVVSVAAVIVLVTVLCSAAACQPAEAVPLSGWDRYGFPGMAFGALFALIWRQLGENTRALRELRDVISRCPGPHGPKEA